MPSTFSSDTCREKAQIRSSCPSRPHVAQSPQPPIQSLSLQHIHWASRVIYQQLKLVLLKCCFDKYSARWRAQDGEEDRQKKSLSSWSSHSGGDGMVDIENEQNKYVKQMSGDDGSIREKLSKEGDWEYRGRGEGLTEKVNKTLSILYEWKTWQPTTLQRRCYYHHYFTDEDRGPRSHPRGVARLGYKPR